MLLVFHIVVALTSLAWATYLFFRPSYNKLHASYALTGLTLASGTALVITTHANLVSSCLTGIIYLAVITPVTIFARQKLSPAK